MDFLDTKAMLALLERIATALEALVPVEPQAEPEQATTEEEKSE